MSEAIRSLSRGSRSEQVLLAIPCYDRRVEAGTALALMKAAAQVRCAPLMQGFSLLACSFNFMLCQALNLRSKGITHFCLLHSDVVPLDDDWLAKLLDELVLAEADAISAVIPIKDDRGLTSTGLDYSQLPDVNPWAVRRLTMAEVMDLPETFDGEAAAAGIADFPHGQIEPVLMVNTGLLVFDLRKPWVEQVCFTIQDKIVKTASPGVEGTQPPVWECFTSPEDWDFSRQLHRLGVPYVATRKVKVEHVGRMTYRNDAAWGRHVTDPAFACEVED